MRQHTRFLMITLLALTLQNCSESYVPLVIGHRGAMGHETENTLVSIQKAMDLGSGMIEIDVFKLPGGEIVVFHDETVDRLTDGTGSIETYHWKDLQKLTLKGNHKIPKLEDVLDLVDNRVRLNIELKGAETAAGVHALVNTYVAHRGWDLQNVIISSFKWDELERIREFNREIPIAVLVADDPLTAVPMAQKLKAEAINPYFKELDRENTQILGDKGFKIYPWTVNAPEDIARMKGLQVDGIITNFPERVR
ncbi:MAG: glycerophosphodiester phosphodiesterase family protein [Bacteroidota bacterium]